jgi:hypothetical protein
MRRVVKPELLDRLPPDDPRAMRSRLDLRRVNAWMGNAGVLAGAMRSTADGAFPERIAELGAGDGTLLLEVARQTPSQPRGVRALLLDKQALVPSSVRTGFNELGWQVETVRQDVLDWLRQPSPFVSQLMVANLFLHHFAEPDLTELLRRSASRTQVFIALDPRRSPLALGLCHLLWLIGCNAVTRHDAVASIHAGFCGPELSKLWPAEGRWALRESRCGLAGHLFIARRC